MLLQKKTRQYECRKGGMESGRKKLLGGGNHQTDTADADSSTMEDTPLILDSSRNSRFRSQEMRAPDSPSGGLFDERKKKEKKRLTLLRYIAAIVCVIIVVATWGKSFSFF